MRKPERPSGTRATRCPRSRTIPTCPDGSSTAPSSRPGRPARPRLAHPLHVDVEHRLAVRGIAELWTHQAAAIDQLHDGGHVVIATGTASGKSLCYQLPIVDAVVRGEADTALLVFPTKALAQDQLRSLRSWLVPGLRAVTYDGDTPPDDRAWARKNANVVLTNPEMLHQGILPYHKRWATFLMRLRHRGRRRAALAARDLREQRRARSAPVAAGLRALRLEPVVLLRERDDREPGRARQRARAASRSPRSTTTAPRRRRGASGSGNVRCSTSTPGGARPRTRRPRSSSPASCATGARRSRSPGAGAAPSSSRARPAAGSSRTSSGMAGRVAAYRAGLPARGAPRARTPARRRIPARRRGDQRAGARASTWAGSTRSCSTASPARGRRCASRPAGRDGPGGGLPRCSWPATTSSTSGTSRIPKQLLGQRGGVRGREPVEPVRAAAAGGVRGARAPARAERRGVVRPRSRRRGARARPRRAAEAAGRQDVLGRP